MGKRRESVRERGREKKQRARDREVCERERERARARARERTYDCFHDICESDHILDCCRCKSEF